MINRKVKTDSIKVWKAEIIEREHIKELLDKIRAEIAEEICLTNNPYTKETKYTIEHLKLLEILDNIGKAESEDT